MLNSKKSNNLVETPAVMNKNADGNFCLTDADMPICPEMYSDTEGFAQMIVTEDGYNFVRQIHCIVDTVSENHAEGHYLVAWTCDDGPCLMKWELNSDFIYDGEIDEGFPNGNGIMKFVNIESDYYDDTDLPEELFEGWNYSGSVRYGVPHGDGRLSGPDGTDVSGIFRNGLLIEGKVIEALGEKDKFRIRRGTFYHGILCGDSCELQIPSLKYCGQFNSFGYFNGIGMCEIAGGIIKDGFWENGDFIRGHVKLNDGSWYIGEWSSQSGGDGCWRKHGGPQGYGSFYYANGDVATGYWDQCHLVDGRILRADGYVEIISPQSES